jgi:regulator of nucleoside diphosphate kinase
VESLSAAGRSDLSSQHNNQGANMEKSPPLIISHDDFQKISSLILIAESEIGNLLEEELGRAKIVSSDQLPKDVVSIDSEVTFLDLDSQKERTLTLTYPHAADIQANRVSVLAPMGAALIGLRVGQTIDWPVPDNKVRRIKVVSVVQP